MVEPESGTKRCPRCGQDIKVEQLFCHYCGQQFADQLEVMTFFETKGEGVLIRWGAVLLDAILISLLYSAGVFLLLAVGGGLSVILSANRPESAWDALVAAVPLGVLLLYPVLWFLYFAIFEGIWGATPGKFIGVRPSVLKVIRKDDQLCGFGRATLRASLGIFEQNILGAIVVAATPLKQRIGDLLAGTLVVDVTKLRRVVFAPDAVAFEYVGGRKVDVVQVTRGVLTKWLGKVQHMTFYGLDRTGHEVKIRARMTTGATVFGQMEAMHDLRRRLEQRFDFQCQGRLERLRLVLVVALLLITVVGLACVFLVLSGSSEAISHNNRGVELSDEGRWEEAIAELDKAIQLDPDFARAYNNRGSVYSEQGQQERAIADYDMAIQLDPEFARAYYYRGRAWSDLGQDEQAIADYDKALSLTSDPDLIARIQQDLELLKAP